jgi:hydrogenase expression/formation protein HypE
MAFRDTHVRLGHGNGGRLMRELIEELFLPVLANPHLDVHTDAAALPVPPGEALVVTTDGFTVRPLEFPGGNIGSLAIHGTVNDLAVSGATAQFITLSVFLEEGLEISTLRRVIAALGAAAQASGVAVVAGDTKVVGRGECDRMFLATTGIGFRSVRTRLAMSAIRAGDQILVSGPVGDHGAAIMLAREDFGLRGTLRSDAASIHEEAQLLLTLPGLRFMRDPTRGGLATVAHELARATELTVHLDESQIPVNDAVRSVCELLGFDPLYLACEGRLIAVVAAEDSAQALSLLRRFSPAAARIGELHAGAAQVTLLTEFGGQRCLDELDEDPLPRIC